MGVADLGFCYADSRQTGRGNDSKTFAAWKKTQQDQLISTVIWYYATYANTETPK